MYKRTIQLVSEGDEGIVFIVNLTYNEYNESNYK